MVTLILTSSPELTGEPHCPQLDPHTWKGTAAEVQEWASIATAAEPIAAKVHGSFLHCTCIKTSTGGCRMSSQPTMASKVMPPGCESNPAAQLSFCKERDAKTSRRSRLWYNKHTRRGWPHSLLEDCAGWYFRLHSFCNELLPSA